MRCNIPAMDFQKKVRRLGAQRGPCYVQVVEAPESIGRAACLRPEASSRWCWQAVLECSDDDRRKGSGSAASAVTDRVTWHRWMCQMRKHVPKRHGPQRQALGVRCVPRPAPAPHAGCGRHSGLPLRNVRAVASATPLAGALCGNPDEPHRQRVCRSYRCEHHTDSIWERKVDPGNVRERKGKLRSITPETHPPSLIRDLEKPTACLLAWVTCPRG